LYHNLVLESGLNFRWQYTLFVNQKCIRIPITDKDKKQHNNSNYQLSQLLHCNSPTVAGEDCILASLECSTVAGEI
ncbi:MAG: hypothetical protein OXU51_16490, partial [Candidatus Poribacteria bacterium]|nr:hypothetical protein [Candidatus Poribacteria bacterium]